MPRRALRSGGRSQESGRPRAWEFATNVSSGESPLPFQERIQDSYFDCGGRLDYHAASSPEQSGWDPENRLIAVTAVRRHALMLRQTGSGSYAHEQKQELGWMPRVRL